MMRRGFLRDETANVALLFGLLLPMLLVGTALAVDSASLYLQRRQMQGALDLATLAASTEPANAYSIIRRELVSAGLLAPGITEADLRAGQSGTRLTIELGRYAPEPTLAVSQRFNTGATPQNAVWARLTHRGGLLFAQSWATPPDIAVESVAAVEAEALFSVGSRLASLSGGLPAAVLGGLLGSGVTLDVMSYNRLLGANVTLLGFMDALSQQIGLGVASYDQLLAAQATEGQVARALAAVLTGADRTAALQIAAAIGTGSPVPVRRLLDLGSLGSAAVGTDGPGLGANVGALDILSAAAALSDGNRQAALAISTGLPGVASVGLTLTIGEPPQTSGWAALGPRGATVRTSQLRLRLDVTVGGTPILLGAAVRLPIHIDMANAEARLSAVTCPTTANPQGSAAVDVRPGVVRLVLGDVTTANERDFGRPLSVTPATLVNVPLLLAITGKAQVDMASNAASTLLFSSTDIANGTLKTARSTGMLQSAIGSLLGDLELTVRVLGLGLSPPALVEAALRALLTPLAPVLDTTLDTVLATLGLNLGEADVRVYGVRCSRPVLVQ